MQIYLWVEISSLMNSNSTWWKHQAALSSKHETLILCWFNVGHTVYDAEPTLNQPKITLRFRRSLILKQHWPIFAWLSRRCQTVCESLCHFLASIDSSGYTLSQERKPVWSLFWAEWGLGCQLPQASQHSSVWTAAWTPDPENNLRINAEVQTGVSAIIFRFILPI